MFIEIQEFNKIGELISVHVVSAPCIYDAAIKLNIGRVYWKNNNTGKLIDNRTLKFARSKIVIIPALRFGRGNDFIYKSKNGFYFFKDVAGDYVQIKNLAYLADIEKGLQ